MGAKFQLQDTCKYGSRLYCHYKISSQVIVFFLQSILSNDLLKGLLLLDKLRIIKLR